LPRPPGITLIGKAIFFANAGQENNRCFFVYFKKAIGKLRGVCGLTDHFSDMMASFVAQSDPLKTPGRRCSR
jgi:hypothetical protein